VRLLPRGASHLRDSRLPAPVPGSSKLIGNPHFSNFILPSGFQGKALHQRCLAYVVPLQLRISFLSCLWVVMCRFVRHCGDHRRFTPFGMPSRQLHALVVCWAPHIGKTLELGFSTYFWHVLLESRCLPGQATKVCELKFCRASRWTG